MHLTHQGSGNTYTHDIIHIIEVASSRQPLQERGRLRARERTFCAQRIDRNPASHTQCHQQSQLGRRRRCSANRSEPAENAVSPTGLLERPKPPPLVVDCSGTSHTTAAMHLSDRRKPVGWARRIKTLVSNNTPNKVLGTEEGDECIPLIALPLNIWVERKRLL